MNGLRRPGTTCSPRTGRSSSKTHRRQVNPASGSHRRDRRSRILDRNPGRGGGETFRPLVLSPQPIVIAPLFASHSQPQSVFPAKSDTRPSSYPQNSHLSTAAALLVGEFPAVCLNLQPSRGPILVYQPGKPVSRGSKVAKNPSSGVFSREFPAFLGVWRGFTGVTEGRFGWFTGVPVGLMGRGLRGRRGALEDGVGCQGGRGWRGPGGGG